MGRVYAGEGKFADGKGDQENVRAIRGEAFDIAEPVSLERLGRAPTSEKPVQHDTDASLAENETHCPT